MSLKERIFKNLVLHKIKNNVLYLWELEKIFKNLNKYKIEITFKNKVIEYNKFNCIGDYFINYFNTTTINFICEIKEFNNLLILKIVCGNFYMVISEIGYTYKYNLTSSRSDNHSLTLLINQDHGKECKSIKLSNDSKIMVVKINYKHELTNSTIEQESNFTCIYYYMNSHISTTNKINSIFVYDGIKDMISKMNYLKLIDKCEIC